jgi:uncharacterized damage-inducible protein DinB
MRSKYMFGAMVLAGAVLALAMFTMRPVAAQEAAKKEAPPAVTATQALLRAWNGEGRKLIAMAEDFPEDKYDYKPNPTQRSFAEQLLHAAGASYAFTDTVTGKGSHPEDMPRDKYKTKAEVVAALKESIAAGAAAIQAKGDAGLAEVMQTPWARAPQRVGDFGYQVAMHNGEHYGQLVGYYRSLNMVPPESRPRK